ncbi:MAG TPA: DNA mismatch repair protein MutS, partial [Syntrophomonadaceae bacterium]|nr:DNA mismatch repair protein MutS [Syntrophomonadaceae bacterium]
PVVECNLTEERFVPNDLVMDNDEHKFAIITGPNMGGKSTFMRQVALIVIMAQMGSFVPADKADLCLVDRVFTRVGASDDLSAGQSTFMVEMVELANILLYSSLNSLIILDEIGRGTSTYDGLCIAQAVCEYIHDQIGAKTLFATHYHEVTALADEFTGIFNLSVSVIESGDTVTFLKRVLPGKADKSYGIHVAKLAGIPSPIIERANELLASIEQTERVQEQAPALSQGSLFIEEGHWLLDELQSLDLDDMSPKDALDLLYNWKQRI